MSQVIWSTDLHLDHCDKKTKDNYYKSLRDSDAEVLLVSGDIANSKVLDEVLSELSSNIKLYFVLGNHDFYGSSISETRDTALQYKESYLTARKVIELNKYIGLIGHDGWYDLRNGIPGKIRLNDFDLISDFSGNFLMYERMVSLAQDAADHFEKYIVKGFKKYQKLILVTHVPPFAEAAFYNGKMSDREFLPYYSSKIEGDVIYRLMEKYIDKELLVLCGHTHGEGIFHPINNLTVVTGKAEYKNPEIQKCNILLDFLKI